MAKAKIADNYAGVSSDAVQVKTRKSWSEWFKLLDSADAAKMPHKEIALLVHTKFGCSGWWSQMVAVAYEQARGLRVKFQTHAGDFSVSASRTIAKPIALAYAAWMNEKTRARWLPNAEFTVTKTTSKRSIRIQWHKVDSRVEVMFFSKGDAKCQVTVQHSKLRNAKEAKAMKSFWSGALDRLKKLLDS